MQNKTKDMIRLLTPVLEKNHPIGARELCYTLEAMGLIQHSGFDKVMGALHRARSDSIIPISWICDESRPDYYVPFEGYDDTADFLSLVKNLIENYHRKFWEAQPNYFELVLEKVGLAHFYKPLCKKYNLRLVPTKGDSSFSQCWEVAQRFKEHNNKNCFILYLGDFNWNGWNIPRAFLRKVTKYSGVDIGYKRIAINPEHILKYPGLPNDVNPDRDDSAKTKKRNFLNEICSKHGETPEFWNKNIELEALKVHHPQEHLKEVEDAIRGNIDFEAWKRQIGEEETDKQELISKWLK